MGTSGILLICIRGVWSPFRCKGNLEILLSLSRGIGPHFELRQETRVPLELGRVSQGSSRVRTGISRNCSGCLRGVKLSICEGNLGIPLGVAAVE